MDSRGLWIACWTAYKIKLQLVILVKSMQLEKSVHQIFRLYMHYRSALLICHRRTAVTASEMLPRVLDNVVREGKEEESFIQAVILGTRLISSMKSQLVKTHLHLHLHRKVYILKKFSIIVCHNFLNAVKMSS